MALSDAEWKRSGLALHWSNRMRGRSTQKGIRRELVKGIRQSQKLEGGVRERQKVVDAISQGRRIFDKGLCWWGQKVTFWESLRGCPSGQDNFSHPSLRPALFDIVTQRSMKL